MKVFDEQTLREEIVKWDPTGVYVQVFDDLMFRLKCLEDEMGTLTFSDEEEL